MNNKSRFKPKGKKQFILSYLLTYSTEKDHHLLLLDTFYIKLRPPKKISRKKEHDRNKFDTNFWKKVSIPNKLFKQLASMIETFFAPRILFLLKEHTKT